MSKERKNAYSRFGLCIIESCKILERKEIRVSLEAMGIN